MKLIAFLLLITVCSISIIPMLILIIDGVGYGTDSLIYQMYKDIK